MVFVVGKLVFKPALANPVWYKAADPGSGSLFHNLSALPSLTSIMQIKALAALFLGSACAATNSAKYPSFYDTTWAGPVRFADNYNISSNTTGFTMAEATLVMPHLSIPKKPHEKATQYTASYWIGLDGYLSSEIIRGLWQAGVEMSVWPNGTTEYTGFHEWCDNVQGCSPKLG